MNAASAFVETGDVPARPERDPLDGVVDILRTVRANLGMDVAFVSQFEGDDRVFRWVDAGGERAPFSAGDRSSLSESYCARVVDGRLPELIQDAKDVPEARTLDVTWALPVGAHLSVPIRLSNGGVYGTFCCFSRRPDPTLDRRDLAMLRTFADIAARQIERDLAADQAVREKTRRIEAVIEAGGPAILFQPVHLLPDLRPVGSEALARFPGEPYRRPDVWFEEAESVGLRIELELAAIRRALAEYRPIWERHPVQLGLNASAVTVVDPRLTTLLQSVPADRIVLELTEHDRIEDYGPLLAVFERLRGLGVKIAIDDVGAGYSSMRHILAIRPDIIKLDMSIVRAIDTDAMKLSLATALVYFAGRFDCKVVAEGIETFAELDVLRCLDVQAVQGYLLARPQEPEALRRFFGDGGSRQVLLMRDALGSS